jgi:hypothetical protein
MSVASRFRYHRPFPFCVDDFDIESIDNSALRYDEFYIKDLTLADAMKLYWLMEKITISFSISGVIGNFYIDSANDYYDCELSCEVVISSTSSFPPRSRVCSSIAISEYGSVENAQDIVPDGSPSPFAVDYDWDLVVSDGSELSGIPVTRQLNGKYTYWFGLRANQPSIPSQDQSLYRPLTISSGGEVSPNMLPAPTAFDLVEVSVLSGKAVVYGAARTYSPFYSYTSGGSLDLISITPTFYTFS